MKDIASWALETAKLRGASHAEARIVDERGRSLATKNGRIAGASDSESMGIGIRVIANGGFGFAATDDLSREGVEGCAAKAVEIARASSSVKGAHRGRTRPFARHQERPNRRRLRLRIHGHRHSRHRQWRIWL